MQKHTILHTLQAESRKKLHENLQSGSPKTPELGSQQARKAPHLCFTGQGAWAVEGDTQSTPERRRK